MITVHQFVNKILYLMNFQIFFLSVFVSIMILVGEQWGRTIRDENKNSRRSGGGRGRREGGH